MANDKIGCSVGRTVLVDPNAFDGQSSLTNISVPNEDLNILVELTTSRKSRTILTTEKEGDSVVNKTKSTGDVSISFIEGTEVSGKKVLTTNYTDLTTSFEDGTAAENLGITNIDIDFSSSYAPQITINFIDLRGGAIFQDEKGLTEATSKYSVFFQLPYPIYSLTIKGYYGKPVKYCLHMISFNSKFNSQTGNFEITAKFIGYTYAMLTDMLLGYLKAIPYTFLGTARFEKLKAENGGVLLTLDELMQKISNINGLAKKIKASDPNSTQLALFEQKKSVLASVETNLNTLGQIDIKNDLSSYPYIIMTTTNPVSSQFALATVANGLPKFLQTTSNSNAATNDAIKRYKDEVTANIVEYNGNNNPLPLKTDDFITLKFYQGLTLNILNKDLNNTANDYQAKRILGQQDDFNQKRTQLYDYLTRVYRGVLQPDQVFDVYDLTNQHQIIVDTITKIDEQNKKLTVTLGQTLKKEVSNAIGFEPTIRNIVKIFSAHVEIFLGVIHDVAKSANGNPNRTKQLKKFSGDAYDYKDNAIGQTGNAVGPLVDSFFPWPDYRKTDDINGLVESYLGEAGVLTKPDDVDELVFINDLLKAFLTSGKINQDIQKNLENTETSWYPVNPVDTRFFNSVFPYKRFKGFPKSDLIVEMMIRGMTYLGYSNKSLSVDEIQAMANIEADSVLNTISDDLVIRSLTQATSEDFINASGKLSFEGGESSMVKVIKKLGTQYYYDYIYDSNTVSPDTTKVIPISGNFIGDWPVLNLANFANSGNVFLTNYGSSDIAFAFDKPYDGGTYVKIISPIEYYTKNSTPLVSGPTPSDGVLDLSKLKLTTLPPKGEGVGFNPFGGSYGYQEFTKLNYGDTNLDGLPFRFMFYDNANFDDNVYNKSNGLSFKRSVSAKLNGTTPTSKFDVSQTGDLYEVPNFINSVMGYVDGEDVNKTIRTNYGKNRLLAKNYLQGSRDISYPFINFQVFNPLATDGNFLIPVSLFGSRFYYEQTGYTRALLFLHTFPWNGLIKNTNESWNFAIDETIFSRPEILNTFGNRAGFVSAPKLWATFIGGMLWRADSSNPVFDNNGKQIDGGSGASDPIKFNNGTDFFIPTLTTSSSIPTRSQYLSFIEFTITEQGKDAPDSPMSFIASSVDYKDLDPILIGLPDQAKKEFKKLFFDFVASNDYGAPSEWETIKNDLEIFSGTSAQWIASYNTVQASKVEGPAGSPQKVVPTALVRSQYKNFDNYIIFAPFPSDTFDALYANNYTLELREELQVNKTLLDKFCEETIIMNTTYQIWGGNDNKRKTKTTGIYVDESDINVYIQTIINKFTQNKDAINGNDKTKQLEQNIFGTADENIIKFQLYRTCKNIYDKWVGGSLDDDIIFQCGSHNNIDIQLAEKARGKGAKPSLIDSFRFVTRSFKDIGDDFIINPLPINDILLNDANSNFYDAISRILTANNFDFIALPSYINYNDPQELNNLFVPYSYKDAISEGASGPSFVCVYVGQTSKNLDFANSDYPNDGFDVRCDKNGNMKPSLPKDFSQEVDNGENKVAVFAVNYGHQNQNIFKDIVLDQGEFSETAESIQITDDISKNGSENNRSFAGQNIYNVYSVRSYKVEVEMMGNAMIQPMMYFQLNNIPMFHGAYMIKKVTHNIKPNFMSTHFTGVRIRKPETPLLDVGVLYMSMLDSMGAADVQATNFTSTGNTSLDGVNVVAGNTVGNTLNNYATGCKAPPAPLNRNFYTKENPGPGITSTKLKYQDLVNYLNSTTLSAAEKRSTYSVAVLEQSKGNNSFNAFGNNLFGFNVEGKFAGTDEAVNNGTIINTFCYGDSERARVFPQFSQWTDSVNLFSQHIVTPRFIDASRVDSYWNQVPSSLNFYKNGVKNSDSDEVQALKFTTIYFMEWNSPPFKADVINSIGNATSPIYVVKYTDPTTGYSRYPKHVHDTYIAACAVFK